MQHEDLLADYLPEGDAAKAIGRSHRTLRNWRRTRAGPPFVKIGNLILYPRGGFRDWLKSQERHPVRSRRSTA
jgi:Helix-turn-helix domain